MPVKPAKNEGRAFPFLRVNDRPTKPRERGITEIRGPYYTPMGRRYLEDVLETMGVYVDALKFAGGSFSLMPRTVVKEAGAYMIMIESEGITENVKTWRTDVPAKIANALGIEKVMFEAADPEVFAWYIKNYGPEVNLFVDHSQVVQLECLRSGIWGTKSLWGRVVTYRG